MAEQSIPLQAFNRGLVSRLALARTDIERVGLSAETHINWVPRVLGSMMIRPGLGYLGSTKDNATSVFLPFIFATDDTALIELTDVSMRVWVDDELVTRANVATAITNGTFTSDVSGWTDADESGGVSVWATGSYMDLQGNGTAAAYRYQQVTVASGDQGVEHALKIVVNSGLVIFRVGSTSSGSDYISEQSLGAGVHSLAFTPTGDFYVQFLNRSTRHTLIEECSVETAGVMVVDAPWAEADLRLIRYDQSGDIIFIACAGYQQRKIERRGDTSWSVVQYEANDGPFLPENTGPITITPSALSGAITLAASAPLFATTNVGSLYRISSSGQNVSTSATAENTFTDNIRVIGVTNQRIFTISLSGLTGTGSTVTLQRSLEEPGTWNDVTSYTANTTVSFDDDLDNQIAYYRIGVKTGGYSSGTIVMGLNYSLGSIDGYVRVYGYTSSTSVSADVISDLGATVATDIWAEGEWSDRRGWPTSVAFHEGRLWWAGKDGIWGSVSDGFYSLDETLEGDAGPIARTVGSGPVDTINWILGLQRMLLGAQGAEYVCKSTSLDEPLTPTNFSSKPASTQGSGAVAGVKIDQRGVYLQKGGVRIYELSLGVDQYEYASTDLTAIVPEVGEPSIIRMAVQRQPDTRLHCVRSDGKVAMMVFEPAEKVLCWLEIETDGEVEEVVVLPGTVEDAVYYVVKRTINGSTKRYLEKWTQESQARGGTDNRMADSHIVYSGAGVTTLTGLDHLEGETVVVWGNGKDLGTKTVSSGQITGISESVTTACVGLTYTAKWKSSKLGRVAPGTTYLTKRGKINKLGVILADAHPMGLQYGPDFDNLDNMPEVEQGRAIDQDTPHDSYDEQAFTFDGVWNTDSRLCLQGVAPRHCTVLAAIVDLQKNG